MFVIVQLWRLYYRGHCGVILKLMLPSVTYWPFSATLLSYYTTFHNCCIIIAGDKIKFEFKVTNFMILYVLWKCQWFICLYNVAIFVHILELLKNGLKWQIMPVHVCVILCLSCTYKGCCIIFYHINNGANSATCFFLISRIMSWKKNNHINYNHGGILWIWRKTAHCG